MSLSSQVGGICMTLTVSTTMHCFFTAVSYASSTDVFLFTLYWNLILHTPIFAFCGLYAFLNFIFRYPTHEPNSHALKSLSPELQENATPIQPSHITRQAAPRISPPKHNPNRTRVTFAIIVLVSFLSAGVLSATLGSAIVGYILVGLFRAARFQISTYAHLSWYIFVVTHRRVTKQVDSLLIRSHSNHYQSFRVRILTKCDIHADMQIDRAWPTVFEFI